MKKVFNYNKFLHELYSNSEAYDHLSESGNYEYDCIMYEVKLPDWKSITDKVNEPDLYTGDDEGRYGIEDDPHVTLIYGLHSGEVEVAEAKKWLESNGPVDIKIVGMNHFETDDYDVVKLEVESDKLHKLRKVVESKYPNTQSFPEYNPHVTVAYVKKGTGKKYTEVFKQPIKLTLDGVIYSPSEGDRLYFKV